jgi:hypothetical protein
LIEGESLENRNVSKVYRAFSQAFGHEGSLSSNPVINTMRALLADAAVPDEALSALQGTAPAAPTGVDPDELTTIEACVQVCKQITSNYAFLRRQNSANKAASPSERLLEDTRLQRISKMFDVVYVPSANPVLKRTVEEKTTNIRGEATTRKQQFNSAAVPLLLTSIDFMTVARLLDAPHVEFLLGKRHEGVSRRRDDSIIVNTLGSAVVAPSSEPALSHLQRVSGLNTRVHVGLYGHRNGGAMRLKALALPVVVPGASTPEQVTPGGTFATAFQEAQTLLTDVLSDDDAVRRDLMREVEEKLKRVQLQRFAYNQRLLADVSPTDFLASSLQSNDVANSITFAGVVQDFHNNLLGFDEDVSPEFVRDFNAFVALQQKQHVNGATAPQPMSAIALHRLNAMMEAKADVFREVRPASTSAPLRQLLSRAVFSTPPEASRNGRAVHIMYVPVHGNSKGHGSLGRGCDAAALGMVPGSRFVTVIIDGNRPRVSVFDPAGECKRETLVVTFAMLLILGVRFRASRSVPHPSAAYNSSTGAFHMPSGSTRQAFERAAVSVVDDYSRARLLVWNTQPIFSSEAVDMTEHLQVPIATATLPDETQIVDVGLHVDYEAVVVHRAVLYPHAALWFAMYHLSNYGRSDTPDDFVRHVQARPILGSGASTAEFIASNMSNFALRLGESCFRPPLDYTPRARKKPYGSTEADRLLADQYNQPVPFWSALASPS